MLTEFWTAATGFLSDAWSELAPSLFGSPESSAEAPPPDVVLDTGGGGGDGGGGGGDTSDGGGGSDTSGGGGGDTGVNWSDTGWSGWSDWDTAYPYVETEDQTCFAAEKYKKPVCYAKGGKEQESELIVQGLKCSSRPDDAMGGAELAAVLVFGVVWARRASR